MEFTIPFVTESAGYITKINGQLMHLDATTSLKYRSLLGCETLEVWMGGPGGGEGGTHLCLCVFIFL